MSDTEEQQDPETFGWDTSCWIDYITEAKQEKIEKARQMYKTFLNVFPTSVKYRKAYIEREIEAKNYEEVDRLFKECLTKTPHVSLWKSYLNYCKLTTKDQDDRTNVLQSVYDYAIENIKHDVDATPIWKDYLQFLQNYAASGVQEENFKSTKIRETFEKAVDIPLANSKEIWESYVKWLCNINKSFQKRAQDRNKKQTQCRQVYTERKTLSDNIPPMILAVPPGEGNSDIERTAVKYWKKIIRFEKRNPLHLSGFELRDKVVFTYKQCLLQLFHYPEIWYDYAKYYADEGLHDKALEVYKEATGYLSDSIILHFAFADYLEYLNKTDEAEKIYLKLLKKKNETLVWIQYMFFKRRVFGISTARKVFLKARRKNPDCTFHIYIASAMMEFYHSKDANLAIKIFDRGFATNFGTDTEYIIHYLKFLW